MFALSSALVILYPESCVQFWASQYETLLTWSEFSRQRASKLGAGALVLWGESGEEGRLVDPGKETDKRSHHCPEPPKGRVYRRLSQTSQSAQWQDHRWVDTLQWEKLEVHIGIFFVSLFTMRVGKPWHRILLRGRGASIPGGAQSSAGHSPEQPDLPGATLSRALNWTASGNPFQPAQTLCLLAASWSSQHLFERNKCVHHTTGAEGNCVKHNGDGFSINTVSGLFWSRHKHVTNFKKSQTYN